MSEEDTKVQTPKAAVKTVASKELDEQVQRELEIEDPDLAKAKAILGLDETDPNESA